MARPTDTVLEQRAKAFTRALVATGGRFTEAQRLAGIDAAHVVRLMDRADFRSLAAHMLAGDLPAVVAVEVVEPERADQVAA